MEKMAFRADGSHEGPQTERKGMRIINSVHHPSPSAPRIISNRTWRRIMEDSLHRFEEFLRARNWFGRENEVVNLFTHEYLAAHVAPRSPLTSLGQLGIEAAVVQVIPGGKQYVRKDLVVWADRLHNPWHPDKPQPKAIVEWKVGNRSRCAADIAWLRRFTRRFPGTIGYSACASMRGHRGLWWVRVEAGAVAG